MSADGSFPVLYAITDRALASGMSHETLVERLCLGGARLIQLREKSMSDADLLACARACVERAAAGSARLIVNDRPDIAHLAGAAGTHLGSVDLPVAEAREILGPKAMIGFSTHGVEEALAAAALPVDYIALGPIFETSHASARRAPLGVEAVARVAAAIDRPLVAIGGINPVRAREVLSAGAAGVAVLGDLMTAADIPSRVALYTSLTSKP